jgi:hypothetical protein
MLDSICLKDKGKIDYFDKKKNSKLVQKTNFNDTVTHLVQKWCINIILIKISKVK